MQPGEFWSFSSNCTHSICFNCCCFQVHTIFHSQQVVYHSPLVYLTHSYMSNISPLQWTISCSTRLSVKSHAHCANCPHSKTFEYQWSWSGGSGAFVMLSVHWSISFVSDSRSSPSLTPDHPTTSLTLQVTIFEKQIGWSVWYHNSTSEAMWSWPSQGWSASHLE